MKRAAILIGVNKTGNLPTLSDAVNGVRRMEQWALSQGLARKWVRTFTDESGPVEVGAIKRALREMVDDRGIEQLIVYFAGHGINIRYGEYWLLSDAPVDSQAAVNVDGSVALARQSGIPHVVLISDACRTAAESIQAQWVTGSEIFPNDPVGGPEQPVDIFFASTLGKPALEVRDPTDSAAVFRALYTGALVDALEGRDPSLLEPLTLGGRQVQVVRPRPLRKALPGEMSRRLAALNLHAKVSQVPDARITSDPDVWLAQLPAGLPVALPDEAPADAPRAPRSSRRAGGRQGTGRQRAAPVVATLQTTTADLLATALSVSGAASDGGWAAAEAELDAAARWDAADFGVLARGARRDAEPFGPPHFESACGFKARGARIVEAHSATALVEPLGGGDLVRVNQLDGGRPASVLLVLADGSSVLLPAIAEFIAALRFEDGELADVAYEPSDNTWRWNEYRQRQEELRGLRGVIANAARLGVFRLEGDDAPALARRMQYAKGIDPSLSLYAAYAFHDQQLGDRIREMIGYLHGDLGVAFFDIGLLGRALDGRVAGDDPRFCPFLPMLGQGWGLLSAYRVSLPAGLQEVRRHLRPSLWSQFTPEGTAMLRKAILERRVR